MSKGLDLKHFKKKSSDKHSTTLMHKDGHEMRIVHSALSPEIRKGLDNLPAMMAEGGEVASNQPQDKPQAPVTINIGQPPAAAPQALVSTPPVMNPEAMAQEAAARSQAHAATNIPSLAGSPPVQPAPSAPSAPVAAPAAAPSQPQATPQNAPISPPIANADPYGIELQQNALGQGIAEQKAGAMGEAQAMGAEGQMQAAALQQQIQHQQENQKNYTQHYDELQAERQGFQQDLIDQHIDPNHFMNSKGTGGKISTAIGLILGGLGGGLTHQENPALKFLNQQIDRDIESQKAELGKKENLLSANMKQFGNLRDATDMTRVMQNDVVVNQLKEAAAKAQSPLAQAQALKAIGVIDATTAPLLSQIALRKTLMSSMGTAQNDPSQMGQVIQAMRQLNPEMAKSMEERFVPGVGMAQVPIPQSARDTIIAKQNLNKMTGELYKWAASHTGSLDPHTINEGKTKAAELQSMYRNAINGGVFKAGEQEFIDQIIDSDPTKFFNSIRVLPKLKEVMNNNSSQLNTLKRGYGLPVSQIQESAPVLPQKK